MTVIAEWFTCPYLISWASSHIFSPLPIWRGGVIEWLWWAPSVQSGSTHHSCSHVSLAYLCTRFLDRNMWTCAVRSVHDLHRQKVPKKMTDRYSKFSNSCQTRFLCLEISGKGRTKGLQLFGSSTWPSVRTEETIWSILAFLLLETVVHLLGALGASQKHTENRLKIKLTQISNVFFPIGSIQGIWQERSNTNTGPHPSLCVPWNDRMSVQLLLVCTGYWENFPPANWYKDVLNLPEEPERL